MNRATIRERLNEMFRERCRQVVDVAALSMEERLGKSGAF
jgi:hypothetical protein